MRRMPGLGLRGAGAGGVAAGPGRGAGGALAGDGVARRPERGKPRPAVGLGAPAAVGVLGPTDPGGPRAGVLRPLGRGGPLAGPGVWARGRLGASVAGARRGPHGTRCAAVVRPPKIRGPASGARPRI